MRKLFVLFLNTMIALSISAKEYERGKKGRIIGGAPAPEGVFNWMVALYFQGTFACSASLISDRLVLTAAHCIVHGNIRHRAEDFMGHAGSVNRSAATLVIEFGSLRVHPHYNSRDLTADVAIMVSKEKINLQDPTAVRRLCLLGEASEKSREMLAMGWGSTSTQFGSFPRILQFTFLAKVKNILCSVIQRTITNATLCARGLDKGICQGDSGGPLIDFNARGIPYQVAVASYVNPRLGCGRLSLYTRIYFYRDFLFDAENEFETSVCFLS